MKNQGRIHIVDDEPIIHEVLTDLLSPEDTSWKYLPAAKKPWRSINPNHSI
jgi:CheY-like chemotaxis protein